MCGIATCNSQCYTIHTLTTLRSGGVSARVAQDQHAYEKTFNAAHQQHQALLAEHAAVVAEIQHKHNRLAAYRYFQQETAKLGVDQLVFSPYLCVTLLDKGTVSTDGNVTFQLRDGSTQAAAVKP